VTRAASTAVQVTYASIPDPDKACNEDLIAAVDGIAMVLEGASVPAGMGSCCDRDAAWYIHRLAEKSSLLSPARAASTFARRSLGPSRAAGQIHAATCPSIAHDRDAMGPSSTAGWARPRPDLNGPPATSPG
jgi:hypothetical protein